MGERWQRVAVGVALAALFVFTFWVYSPPAPELLGWFLVLAGWALVGAIWLAWLVWTAIQEGGLEVRPAIFVVPVLILVTAFLVLTDVPMEARFKISEPSMTNAAEYMIEHPKSADNRSRVGSYKAYSVEAEDGVVQFTVPDLGFLESYGFVYSQRGELPEAIATQTIKKMNDHWWAWTQEF